MEIDQPTTGTIPKLRQGFPKPGQTWKLHVTPDVVKIVKSRAALQMMPMNVFAQIAVWHFIKLHDSLQGMDRAAMMVGALKSAPHVDVGSRSKLVYDPFNDEWDRQQKIDLANIDEQLTELTEEQEKERLRRIRYFQENGGFPDHGNDRSTID